jgi:integrase
MLRGRQCFESTKSPDLQVAEAKLLEKRSDVAAGRITVPPSKAPLLDDLLKAYIAQIDNANTAMRYSLSRRVLTEHFGRCRITDLNAFAIDDFKAARRRCGVTRAGVNRELALLRSSLNLAVTRRLIAYSPFAGVTLFDEAKDRMPPRSLSFAEEKRLLACCDFRLKTIVLLLLETGLRVGIEGLTLKWKDVDFVEGTITVVRSKTAAGQRVIPMSALCNAELLKWCTATTGISEYVFFNPQRPSAHIRSVKTAWHNALKASGLSAFPIYQCRHNFATRLAAAGVSDSIIDQLLGHSRRDVLRFYTARVPEYLRDAIARLVELRSAKTQVAASPTLHGLTAPTGKGSILVN